MINSENAKYSLLISDSVVKELIKSVVAETMVALGVSSGELSYSKARSIYGQDFVRLEKAGKVRPCRVGNGKTATKWFKVSDISIAKMAEERKAEIQCKGMRQK